MARPVCPAPPPPKAAGHATASREEEEASHAASGAGSAAHQGFMPAGLAALATLWAPLGASSPHPMAQAHPGYLAAPADPTATPAPDS